MIAYAATATIVRASGRTEYSVIDERTGRKVAHISVIRGFAHIDGFRGTAFEGLRAVVGTGDAEMVGVKRALAKGLRHGRDDRSDGV